MQAAIYARISHDPRGELLGVNRQLEDCRVVAEQAGWTVADTYIDNDASATSGKPRPDYRRMLTDMANGRFGAIIAWHPDRLYRVLADLEELIKLVEKHDIALRTVKAGDFDLSTSTGKMVARILGAVSTNEGEAKSDRWRRSWRQRRELGHVTPAGWRTFGYTRDGEIVPDEADRLRTIAAEVSAGKGIRTVCAELNVEGIPTTRGGRWEPNGMRKLLRNPRLAGYTTIGYSETYVGPDGQEHQRRLTEIVGDGDWEPVLDRDTWHTLSALLDARSTPMRPRAHLLSGMLRCGLCGTTLYPRKGRGYVAYKCLTSMGGCGKVDVKGDRVEELVQSVARARLSDERIRRRLGEIRAGGQGHIIAEIDTLQTRLTELYDQLADPGRHQQALLRAADKVRDRIDTLQARLTVTTPVQQLPEADEWPDDLGLRRRLVMLVCPRIWVDPAPGRGRFHPGRVRFQPA